MPWIPWLRFGPPCPKLHLGPSTSQIHLGPLSSRLHWPPSSLRFHLGQTSLCLHYGLPGLLLCFITPPLRLRLQFGSVLVLGCTGVTSVPRHPGFTSSAHTAAPPRPLDPTVLSGSVITSALPRSPDLAAPDHGPLTPPWLLPPLIPPWALVPVLWASTYIRDGQLAARGLYMARWIISD